MAAKTKKTTETKALKVKAPAKKREGLSMIEAARKVLADKGEAMSCRDMVSAMTEKGYWKSAKGLTPANTLYSAILREIGAKGKAARFKRTERGKFALA